MHSILLSDRSLFYIVMHLKKNAESVVESFELSSLTTLLLVVREREDERGEEREERDTEGGAYRARARALSCVYVYRCVLSVCEGRIS